jgi:cellobiose phosphorylase
VVDPTIPAMWPGFSMKWTIDSTRYEIEVANPTHQCSGVGTATLDGEPIDASQIPLILDGRTHRVALSLGKAVEPTAVGESSQPAFDSGHP